MIRQEEGQKGNVPDCGSRCTLPFLENWINRAIRKLSLTFEVAGVS